MIKIDFRHHQQFLQCQNCNSGDTVHGRICSDDQGCKPQSSKQPLHQGSNPADQRHVPWRQKQPCNHHFRQAKQNKPPGHRTEFSWGAAAHHSRLLANSSTKHYHSQSGDFGRCAHCLWQKFQQLEQDAPEEGEAQTFFFNTNYYTKCKPTK